MIADQVAGLRAYIAVTAAYWAFMLTDGTLRMLVLLHFHLLGFSPVQLAYLFILYEVAGIITNLCAGWIAARYGLSQTLFSGLGLQVLALLALTLVSESWTLVLSVVFVMCAQGASGVAKDLTKMSSKSAVKLLAPSKAGGLFRWVAILTGSKNAVKGLGFFLGASTLGLIGFSGTLWIMAGLLFLIFIALYVWMPTGLPRGTKDAKFWDVLSQNHQINWLSLARIFLFGARDVWFVVGIPIYFYAVLSDGSNWGTRLAFFQIGAFMAIWIMLYGAVQAAAPRIMGSQYPAVKSLGLIFSLAIVPAALAGAVATWTPNPILTVALMVGLLMFGVLFALASSLHSYLILAYSRADRVTMDVGFYYMANAAGRLIGTLLSGVSYQVGGLTLCLTAASVFLIISGLSMIPLQRAERHQA